VKIKFEYGQNGLTWESSFKSFLFWGMKILQEIVTRNRIILHIHIHSGLF